jgi:erythronate-4-phosphate dehydrogenase
MSRLRIVADNNIPCVQEAFRPLGSVRGMSGEAISSDDLQEADALLVRSVTSVGPELLKGTPVQFVGSATAGVDHVNAAYLRAADIAFAHAPGSNAPSVADYAVAAVLWLAWSHSTDVRGRTAGVIGCGHVGARVARRLEALGLRVLRNDPPLADAAEAEGRAHPYVPLSTVQAEADLLSLHVPLTEEGLYSTRSLVDESFLSAVQEETWLLNTARGPVIEGRAVRDALQHGRLSAAVVDVWPNEPTPDPALLRAVDLATPHVAGYAYDGKVRGTAMLHEALCRHFGYDARWTPSIEAGPSADDLRLQGPDPRLSYTDWLHRLARRAYDIRADHDRLMDIVNRPPEERAAYFQDLRATYPIRREMQQYRVRHYQSPQDYRTAVTEGLTMEMKATMGRGYDR